MDTWIRQLLCAAVVAMTLASTPAHAQSCSDGNECTNPDMCSGGSCSGTPVAGSCDDGNPCTINDTCVSGTCQGEPNVGAVCGMTGCEGMCGPNGFCLPDGEKQGDPCTDNLGECTTDDQCIGTVCFGALKVCPDADSNPCTVDVCNFANGQCMTFGATPCGECETCDAEGGCVAANDGADCDDFNECTGSGTCNGGLCTNGAAVGTPTETGSPLATLTDTPTPTVTDTPVAEVGTPTDTPTGIPTGTTAMATATATGIPTGTTAMATATATGIPTGTATATATVTATGATATATFTATGIPTGTATATATGLPTGTATATATVTATGLPTGTATATATATNTLGGNTATVTVTRTSTPTVMIPATSTATSTRTPLPVVASIIVGTAVGAPNTTAALDVTLDTDADIAGVQVDIAYPAVAPIAAKEDGKPDCTVNPEIDKDATSFAFLPSDCTPGDDCNAVRAIVLSIANLDPIPDGSRLFTCNVAISAEATGELPLPCSNAGAGNTDGDKVGADCTSGTITVAEVKDATLVVSDVVGAAGGNATVTVSLETEVLVAGTQNDLVFPAGVGVVADDRGRPACFVNPDIGKDATSFAYQPPGCTPGDDCTGVRALVLALSNVEPIPSGSVLYTCEVTIGSEVANGTYPLMCTNDGASDPDGNEVSTLCADSDVIVGVLPITPTDTPTGTPSVSPTVTPTASPTPNITPPTATPTGTPTVTGTRTHKPSAGFDDDSCQVVAPAAGGEAWLLLLPVAALLWRRRR